MAYAIVLGIWLEVYLYCALHDLYLIRIAPEHFTVYHPPLGMMKSLNALALAWAFKASVGPGLGLGMAALFAGRAGGWPKMPVRRMLFVVAVLIAVTELCGLAAGAYAWNTGRMIYPEIIYPEETRPLITTQTIQVTCYLVGGLLAVGFLGWVVMWRRWAS